MMKSYVTLIAIQNTFFAGYKDFILIFNLISTSSLFFFVFCFNILKMVDNKYSTVTYKTLKISIGAIMKDAEMLEFVSDHLMTKNMCLKYLNK